MRKQPEVEDAIKTIIRDELALRPLISVQKIRIALYVAGYCTEHGTLDWHYVSKLMMRVRRENLASLNNQDRYARLVALKERHRVLTEKLVDIAEGKATIGFEKAVYPTPTERIAAANTVLKWDTAVLFAEEAIDRGIEKPEPIALIIKSGKVSKTKKWSREVSNYLNSSLLEKKSAK